jgi:hypothetical protein
LNIAINFMFKSREVENVSAIHSQTRRKKIMANMRAERIAALSSWESLHYSHYYSSSQDHHVVGYTASASSMPSRSLSKIIKVGGKSPYLLNCFGCII